jgi:D-serine deaminase-like pyridoxal phosphate-dependent protein
VNDQHAFVRIPADTQIRPGEILSFGISHPCGGFDRWRFIPIVAPNHDVTVQSRPMALLRRRPTARKTPARSHDRAGTAETG